MRIEKWELPGDAILAASLRLYMAGWNSKRAAVRSRDSSKTRSFLSAARVANLPGVACHVITGALLACWLMPDDVAGFERAPWPLIATAASAGVLLCMAGNLLNDWHDRAWDAEYRPERALPSGHFRAEMFLAIGSACLVLGVAAMFYLSAPAGGIALVIAVCVAIYTRSHKHTVWSVVPLALCRGLLPLMGALAMTESAVWGHPAWTLILALCGALFLWVCGLSLDARGESTGGSGRSLTAWMLILAAPLFVVTVLLRNSLFSWVDVAPVALWLAMVRGPLRHTAKQRVSALLAGMPLLDFMVLAPAWNAAVGAPLVILWIPMIAFGLGRMLQRAAAAT